MARAFSLLGLLRLRHAQQDQAAGHLADANERLREASDRRMAARRTIDESPVEITDAAMLSAVAAARASTRGMLHELDAVAQKRRAEAEEAQVAFNDARRAAIGLEKLEAKHAAAEAATDLRDEQLALDEIATTSWRPRETPRTTNAETTNAETTTPDTTTPDTTTPGGAA